MKKTFALTLLAVACIAFSCQRMDESINFTSDNDVKYPNIVASISDDTRISFDGTALEWTAGDKISVTKNGGTAIYKALSSGKTSEFEYVSGSFGTGTGSYVAYYPSTLAGTLATTFVSDAGELSQIPLRGEAAAIEDHFNFCAFGGVMEFNVAKASNETQPIKLSQITITAKEAITGAFTDMTANGEVASQITGTGKTITLKLNSPLEIQRGAGTPIYVPVPALTYSAGLTVLFTADNCAKKVVTTTPIVLERAHVQPIRVNLSTTRGNDAVAKVTNDGGNNWLCYADLNSAAAAITTAGAKDQHELKLVKDYEMGASEYFSLSGKKFTFNGDGHELKIPDQTAANVGTTISLTNSADVTVVNITVVGSGSEVTALNRPFATTASTLTFGKDCIVKGFKTKKNGAVVWGNSASVINMEANAKIADCHCDFKGSSYGGGALCSDGSIYLKDNAVISGCTSVAYGGAIITNGANLVLSGNSRIETSKATLGGGAISGTNSSNKIVMKDNACIKSCVAESGSGGGIRETYLAATVTLQDNAYVFNCKAATHGGGIDCSGTYVMGGTSKIENCTAKFGGGLKIWRVGTIDGDAVICGCKADCGGAVYDTTTSSVTSYGHITFKGNSKVENCTAQRGGGIYTCKNSVILCTFTGNSSLTGCVAETGSSTYGGGIFANGAVTIESNATIADNLARSTGSGSGYGCAICAGTGTVTIKGGTVVSDSKMCCVGVSNAEGKVVVTAGRVANFGTGSIFTKSTTTAGPINVSGGYFNKDFNSNVTLPEGYVWESNPLATEADLAAYTDGYKFAVFAK